MTRLKSPLACGLVLVGHRLGRQKRADNLAKIQRVARAIRPKLVPAAAGA